NVSKIPNWGFPDGIGDLRTSATNLTVKFSAFNYLPMDGSIRLRSSYVALANVVGAQGWQISQTYTSTTLGSTKPYIATAPGAYPGAPPRVLAVSSSGAFQYSNDGGKNFLGDLQIISNCLVADVIYSETYSCWIVLLRDLGSSTSYLYVSNDGIEWSAKATLPELCARVAIDSKG
ncbi:hypothetical protein, partial [Pandoraea sputorum]